MKPTPGVQFLEKKYKLSETPEVNKVMRAISLGKKDLSKTLKKGSKQEKVAYYLKSYEDMLNLEDQDVKREKLDKLKERIHEIAIIKELPESYRELQRRIAREQGLGDIVITDEMRKDGLKVVRADQTASLDAWIDYLAGPDATYPMRFKYRAIKNVVAMGSYDKKIKKFSERTSETTAPFVDINREALAMVQDEVLKDARGPRTLEFKALLEQKSFPKFYSYMIENLPTQSDEVLRETRGEWVKYPQGSDHMNLVKTLQGKGTGRCTAAESTARKQLGAGDFYVYYSYDKKGNPTIPRVAIRMVGNKIAELRGIGYEQNLDEYIGEVAEKKLTEFADGEKYKKKSADMKKLTLIDHKISKNLALTEDEVRFLYELDDDIEGFGYQADPRIGELKKQRDTQKDCEFLYPEVMKVGYGGYISSLEKKQNSNQAFTQNELLFLYRGSRHIQQFGFKEDPRIQEIKAKRNLLQDCEILYPEMFARGYNDHDKAWIAHALLELKNPKKNIEKINAINFNEKTIEIAGLKFEREDMKASKNTTLKKGKDYFIGYNEGKSHPEFKDEQYFTWKKGNEEAQAQGKRLPSKEEREKAAQAIPGTYKAGQWCESFKELSGLLGLKRSGFRHSGGDRFYASAVGLSRSSSEYSTRSVRNVKFNGTEDGMYQGNKQDAFPCRCVQD